MRSKRPFLIALWLAGICLVLLLVLAGWENWRGKQRLARIVQHIESSGGSLDVQRAFARSVPDAENGAVALSSIADRLSAFRQVVTMPPRAMVMDAPGFARSYIDAEGWEDALGNQYPWQQVENARDESRALIAELAEVAARPRFATSFDPSGGVADMKLESLLAMTGVTRVCQTETMLALRAKEHAAAAHALEVMINLYCNKAEDPIAIAQMLRWSQARVAVSLTWELLQHAELEDSQWRTLQQSWERCDFVTDSAKTWEVEMAGVMDVYARLKGFSVYRHHLLDSFKTIEAENEVPWNPPARGWLLERAILPLWTLLWADQNHAEALEHAASEWQLARFARTNSWAATQLELQRLGRPARDAIGFLLPGSTDEPLGYYDRCRYLFATGPTLIKGSHAKRAIETQAKAVLAAAAIALKRFQLRHGNHPVRLEQLVPEFRSSIPLDPMDQQPLRYLRAEDGGFLLYSVGANGIDDGGSLESAKNVPPLLGKLWTSMDTVWPQLLN